MTAKVTIISNDKEITGFIKITALTLSKLNKLIYLTELQVNGLTEPEKDIETNTSFIIIDIDEQIDGLINYIKKIRQNKALSSNKILSIYSSSKLIDRTKVFSAGCDSIMTKEEFRSVADKIFLY